MSLKLNDERNSFDPWLGLYFAGANPVHLPRDQVWLFAFSSLVLLMLIIAAIQVIGVILPGTIVETVVIRQLAPITGAPWLAPMSRLAACLGGVAVNALLTTFCVLCDARLSATLRMHANHPERLEDFSQVVMHVEIDRALGLSRQLLSLAMLPRADTRVRAIRYGDGRTRESAPYATMMDGHTGPRPTWW